MKLHAPPSGCQKTLRKAFAILGLSAIAGLHANAALVVTNGGFGTSNQNGATVSGGGWFECNTANWGEGTWSSAGTASAGDSYLLLFDGGSTTTLGYVYQSLGTVDASDIAAGTLRITADFAEKNNGTTNTAVFSFYKGSFTGATGTDIASGGLVHLGDFTLDAAAQGCTYASGNTGRYNSVLVGNLDLSGLTAGDQIWMRIGESRPLTTTGGDLMIDNVAVTAVPEPSTYGLLGAGAFAAVAFLRRRRKRHR